ncbi:MAG: transcription initiation factor IIB family protein [Candidatus Micrarchaeota archaeon]|nr:transcription initiation factor IIB family protein [Candidatus Micrarchaeota archaeon]MDE1804480.1 transcription initiation factor IIB family protein [Candidatus Micrarchaeota archaeon]MDE1846631.1 transcription initiation factor IIB family protein [Candidatus Micrarchaeota archaeon]
MGNQETLKESLQNSLRTSCPRCKGPLCEDSERGEIVCTGCGLVTTERTHENRLEAEPSEQHNSIKLPFGSSVVIDGRNKDFSQKPIYGAAAEHAKRLRLANRRARGNYTEVTLGKVAPIIEGWCTKLDLNQAAIDRVQYLFRQARELGLTKGRGPEVLVAASIYFACREMGINRTLKEVSNVSGIKEKRIRPAFRQLTEGMEGYAQNRPAPKHKVKLPSLPKASHYVSKIGSAVGASQKSQRDALEIVRKTEGHIDFEGKFQVRIVAAALFASCIRNGEKVHQYDIAAAARVTGITIRNNFKALKNANLI